MQLALDFGNTRIKWGVFDGDQLTGSGHFENQPSDVFLTTIKRYPIKKAMYLATRNDAEDWLSTWIPSMPIQQYTEQIPIPLEIEYFPNSSLGKDRIAAAIGAKSLFPDTALLVIDMGTCITIDRVSASGKFLGGNISPGIEMRLRSFPAFTARLPLVKADMPQKAFGDSTVTAMQNGAVRGSMLEIQSWIQLAQDQCENMQVVFTGGDVHFFEKFTNNQIFADPNLVLFGVNEIIRYND